MTEKPMVFPDTLLDDMGDELRATSEQAAVHEREIDKIFLILRLFFALEVLHVLYDFVIR